MKSRLPKVLHQLAGKSLLAHVINTARTLNPAQLVVVTGHESDKVRSAFEDSPDIIWVEQTEQLGTGHAVQQALPNVTGDDTLVLYGDVPLTRAESLQQLIASSPTSACTILTMEKDDPTGYGRIIRSTDSGNPVAIVEQKDADPEQLGIKEVNTGVMAVATTKLRAALAQLSPDNAQGELYLTDVVEILVKSGEGVTGFILSDAVEAEGVNSRTQLEALERIHQRRVAETLMASGTTLADASRIDVRGCLTAGSDSFIDVNCIFEGDVTLGEDVHIGPNCHLIDCTVAAGTRVHANTVIESSSIGERCELGPFARVRPGTIIESKGKLGNFVEVKKSHIGEGSKVNHLSYVGDCEMGSGVNVGAGTITCNYDGANKHKTIIQNDVFIGSNSALVAPITIGKTATIGAGSTLSSDVEENTLTYTRASVRSSTAWKRPVKKQK